MRIRKIIDIEIYDLGDRIRRARERDGRSVSELAHLAEMTASNWYRIESNNVEALPFETYQKICKVLKTDDSLNEWLMILENC